MGREKTNPPAAECKQFVHLSFDHLDVKSRVRLIKNPDRVSTHHKRANAHRLP